MAVYGRSRSSEPSVLGRVALITLVIGVIIALALQSSPEVRNGLQASRARMDDISSRIMMRPTRAGAILLTDAQTRDRMIELEKEVASLERWRQAARTMSARMVEYERILNIIGEPQAAERTARVIAEENGPFTHTVLANSGARQGIRSGFAAVNAYGLVGRVLRTGQDTSRVLLLTDYNSRVPVMGRVSLDRALLIGDGDRGGRLQHAETPDLIVEGEEWVTSGDDGVFPRGITVGFAYDDGEDWRLDLAMRRAGLDYLRLLPQPTIPLLIEVDESEFLPEEDTEPEAAGTVRQPASVPLAEPAPGISRINNPSLSAPVQTQPETREPDAANLETTSTPVVSTPSPTSTSTPTPVISSSPSPVPIPIEINPDEELVETTTPAPSEAQESQTAETETSEAEEEPARSSPPVRSGRRQPGRSGVRTPRPEPTEADTEETPAATPDTNGPDEAQ